MKDKILELLKLYSGKGNVHLTQRGNKSILFSFKIARELGKKNILIQDQGGWITYSQYAEKFKFNINKLNTDYGLINPNQLSKTLDDSWVVIVNSMTGYFIDQPMGLIYAICKQKNALLINDASGSIGTENAKIGDIIVGSFGENKPVNLNYGGFIAYDSINFDKSILDSADFEEKSLVPLKMKLQKLPERLRKLELITKRVKKDLMEFDIIHKGSLGINVAVKYKDYPDMHRIIKYCEKNNFEYTECPRYTRVNANAICIEIKRLK